MQAATILAGATPRGLLLVMAIVVPATGILLLLTLGGRFVNRIVAVIVPASFVIAAAVFATVWRDNQVLTYIIGGWLPPLGVAFRADGISAAMMLATAIIIAAIAVFAQKEFGQPRDKPEERGPIVFWALLLAIWSALNTIFLSGDLFNLYVAIELLTFGAIPIVSLKGGEDTLRAALRYLLFALLGSMLYLLGIAMLYGAYGTLDIALLAQQVRPERIPWIAAALMTFGLLAKTALFPFHLWLPPAHAGAPAAGSAVLSALVVKGSFFLLVRLWFNAFPSLNEPRAMQLLAALGAAAVLVGSVVALRQARLKMLVAYSTVAQIGYLFFMFPLVSGHASDEFWSGMAWTGGWLQAMSHAFAKAAMFMAAGLIAEALGHDRIAEFDGIGRALPLTIITFGLAGLSLMGVPPSGGFVAKWLLMASAVMEDQWWWAAVMLVGGLLAGGYVFMVLGKALSGSAGVPTISPVARSREVAALLLAVCALLLGLMPLQPSELLQIGRP